MKQSSLKTTYCRSWQHSSPNHENKPTKVKVATCFRGLFICSSYDDLTEGGMEKTDKIKHCLRVTRCHPAFFESVHPSLPKSAAKTIDPKSTFYPLLLDYTCTMPTHNIRTLPFNMLDLLSLQSDVQLLFLTQLCNSHHLQSKLLKHLLPLLKRFLSFCYYGQTICIHYFAMEIVYAD